MHALNVLLDTTNNLLPTTLKICGTHIALRVVRPAPFLLVGLDFVCSGKVQQLVDKCTIRDATMYLSGFASALSLGVAIKNEEKKHVRHSEIFP